MQIRHKHNLALYRYFHSRSVYESMDEKDETHGKSAKCVSNSSTKTEIVEDDKLARVWIDTNDFEELTVCISVFAVVPTTGTTRPYFGSAVGAPSFHIEYACHMSMAI